MVETRVYDTAEYLDTPEMIAEYLTEALESDDAAFVTSTLATVARARGMTVIAEAAGVPRADLCHALAAAAVNSATIRQVLAALGVQAEHIPKAKVA
jgi:probable addiction module antidote protein